MSILKRFLTLSLGWFFPLLAIAADGDGTSSLSFAPPASDYSVVFLGNIFGIVDGILHGTGSQIMGTMFAVFNAAVLALGGMIIMYTLIVSTLNTAQEGQLLGQKWSSIWIPVRSVIGLTLLIPKASGYCLMQIFVMWVVVQGVGAADKIWSAALDYLNRGGVIVQAEADPTQALLHGANSGTLGAAQVILAGQVCMLGLQEQLQAQLDVYKKRAAEPGGGNGPCSGNPQGVFGEFCKSANVPNFINTINVVSYQDKHPKEQSFKLDMPHFDTAPYSELNGVCGTITWNALTGEQLSNIGDKLNQNDLKTVSISRAIAVQQMYMDLASVAQLMVSNDPALGSKKVNSDPATDFSPIAIQPFGMPETAYGETCAGEDLSSCILWGTSLNGSKAPLLRGSELMGAAQDYRAIMLPTLNLLRQGSEAQVHQRSRAFIKEATAKGWIMAGSYFYNLVNLNVAASRNSDQLSDVDTGLPTKVELSALTSAFTESGCKGTFATLCIWLGNDVSKVNAVKSLIDGSSAGNQGLNAPDLNSSQDIGAKTPTVIVGTASSTVFGYTNNATLLRTPGQPGNNGLKFAKEVKIEVDTKPIELPAVDFPCGRITLLGCFGEFLGNLFYNTIIRGVMNAFLVAFHAIIEQVLYAFLMLPIKGMGEIFKYGLDTISAKNVNPIVALATMGTFYINFAAQLWLKLTELSLALALIPWVGGIIFALLTISMPLLMAWLGIMLGIGFTTAYYVPLLPYMIFTFGAIAWLMAVIEAMVAGPIVALGITHPEGHDAFGKGEGAVMILMNVFLRPPMMIIGYIAAISLSYVSVWILNAGFDTAISFITGDDLFGGQSAGELNVANGKNVIVSNKIVDLKMKATQGGYVDWAGVFAYFFSIISYTMIYLVIVQKAFTLITMLPDKILRWIGGQQESFGADTAQWGQEVQSKVSEAGKDTASGQAQMDKQLEAVSSKMISKITGSSGSGSEIGGKGGKGGGKGGAGGAEGGGSPPPTPPPV